MVLTRKSSERPTSLEGLAPFKIGVQENSSHHGWIKEQKNLSPVVYHTAQEALQALSKGDIPAAVGNLAASLYTIQQLHLENLRIAFPAPGGPQNLAFGVRKDWPELVSILNKTIAAISSQTALSIRQKWIGGE